MLESSFSFKKYYDAVDSLLNHADIGRPCTIFYPPIRQDCDNCVTNPMAGGGGGNRYKEGGPAPFNFGNCPMCGGQGYKESENTADLTARVYWRRRDWIITANMEVPQNGVQIITWMYELPKIRRAEKIRVYNDLGQFSYWDCSLSGEPTPHGFGDRYVLAMLKRL